jgi:RIO kinase 1
MSRHNSDNYEGYEAAFDPLKNDRKGRRQRKPKDPRTQQAADPSVVTPKKTADDLVEQQNEFPTTYQPSKYEGPFLLSSLRPFFEQTLITDIYAMVKGGKEASVYRCQASPALDMDMIAAKVYRPRMFRSLSNDAMYKEGRAVLTSEGRMVKNSDQRTMRALGKKTGFGSQVAHTSWLMYEFTSLQFLHSIGAAVPKPVASAENAILMEYIGDETTAAPALSEVRLDRDEAVVLFKNVIDNIELMLRHEMIHGDLSAYNILYWNGKATLIDFPQVSSLQDNRNARFILARDVERVCTYFERQGVKTDFEDLMERLWGQYGADSAGNPGSFADVSVAEQWQNDREEKEIEDEEKAK